MPSLPLFPAGGLRQWMSGPCPEIGITTECRDSVRRHEDGIRGSDESGNLHDSEAVLQHISQSSRNPNDRHIGTDGRRMTSHGSTTAASDLEASFPVNFDNLENEIETIRVDVRHMRAEAKREQRAGEQGSTHRQHDLPPRAESSKIPASVGSLPAIRTSDSSKRDVATSSGKKPALTGTAKRSYAQTATHKLSGLIGVTTGSRQSGSNKASPDSDISPTDFGASPTTMQNTPQQTYYDAVDYLQGTPSSDKSSPHFAQPTQAATRRVDQTLHRDTSPVKPSPEASSERSTRGKAPNLETDKRAAQRQQKRTSLPEGWMSTPEQASSTEKNVQKKKKQVVPRATASSSPGKEHSPAGSLALRKKTRSYMSPTKSAQHRSMATIGQDNTRKISPRLRDRGLTVNTTLANNNTGFARKSGRGSDSDDIFFSPKSRFSSKNTSKAGSPLKAGSLDGSSGNERPNSAMRLPLPLPKVANTVISPRDPGHGFLDHIKEQLGKEDLLRRKSTQEQTSLLGRRGSRSDISKPVYARLNRHGPTGYTSPSSVQSNDSFNQPISHLTTGLRGQTSAAIGKALAVDQHGSEDNRRANTTAAAQPPVPTTAYQGRKPSSESTLSQADLAIISQGRKPSVESALSQADPAIVYQGRKPSASIGSNQDDPAILYQGRKPSASSDLPHDPAILFSSEPTHLGTPNALESRGVSQPSLLRATAIDFVPALASQHLPQDEDSPTEEPQPQTLQWPPPSGLDLFYYDDEPREDPGMTDEQRISLLPKIPRDRLHEVWDAQKADDLLAQQTCPQMPHMSRISTVDNIFDPLFGYAPYGGTPTISPTSSSTSPPSSQDLRGLPNVWCISGHGRRKYHWTGRDGLEITFKGMGPDAEHDPDSPVMYQNYRANTKTFHMHAASFPRTAEPGSSLPPDAPKLMREYADKVGYPMAPCLDDQWKGKYNSFPAIVPVAGLCSCCKSGDHTLSHIGGGVDLLSKRMVPISKA